MLQQLTKSLNGSTTTPAAAHSNTEQKQHSPNIDTSYTVHSSDYHQNLLGSNLQDWDKAIDSLAETISKYDDKVIGVGHSGGGTLIAATRVKYPNLFRDLILYDPALFR